jgi:hypothetical protein
MKVYAVLYGVGWPDDGDALAGIYSTLELAEAARAHDKRSHEVVEIEIDAPPDFTLAG